jgi:RNA polymerase-interacting CarD/CdnL/TRCF family regulator
MPTNKYAIGDWIVHVDHGLGQIKGKETKPLGGNKSDLYRVETLTGIYRLLTELLDTDHVRPIASSKEMDHALHIIQEYPQKLPVSSKELKKKILHVRQDISLDAKAKTIRDLHAKSKSDGIDLGKELFLTKFKKEFANELSIVKETTMANAEEIMEKALATGAAKGVSTDRKK